MTACYGFNRREEISFSFFLIFSPGSFGLWRCGWEQEEEMDEGAGFPHGKEGMDYRLYQ